MLSSTSPSIKLHGEKVGADLWSVLLDGLLRVMWSVPRNSQERCDLCGGQEMKQDTPLGSCLMMNGNFYVRDLSKTSGSAQPHPRVISGNGRQRAPFDRWEKRRHSWRQPQIWSISYKLFKAATVENQQLNHSEKQMKTHKSPSQQKQEGIFAGSVKYGQIPNLFRQIVVYSHSR